MLLIRLIVNPHGKGHGAPSDSDRHVGDLGNVKTDGQGNANGSVQDNHIKLIGQHSVIGVGRSAHQDLEQFMLILNYPENCRRPRWHG